MITKKKILFFIILITLAIGAYGVLVREDRDIMSEVRCWTSDVNCAWYAVHLSNGQAYFGRISDISRDTVTLVEAYYIEKYETGDRTISESKNFAVEQSPKEIYRLVKRGDEKSLATDHILYINRNAVLFWEKLSADSDILASINAVMAQKTEDNKQ